MASSFRSPGKRWFPRSFVIWRAILPKGSRICSLKALHDNFLWRQLLLLQQQLPLLPLLAIATMLTVRVMEVVCDCDDSATRFSEVAIYVNT